MQPLSGLLPKPLLPIDNKPVIYHTLLALLDLDLDGIGIVINPEDNKIFSNFLSHFFENDILSRIDVFHQMELDGIVPAIQTAKRYRDCNILVCAGDTKFDDYEFFKFYEASLNDPAILLGVRKRSRAELLKRSVVVVDTEFRVKNAVEKPTEKELDNLDSIWSGVPIWYFSSDCWSAFSDAQPSKNGEIVVAGVIAEILQQEKVVKAIEMQSRDITSPTDVLLENFPYVSKLMDQSTFLT